MAKANIEVVDATQEYVDGLKGRLRDSDEEGCWAAAHITADEGLQRMFDKAYACWVVLKDKVPIMCWGVSRKTMLSPQGTIWLFSTDAICDISIKVVRHTREYLEYMLAGFDFLETWVDARNKASLAWLKYCGFTVGEAELAGLDNLPFHRLWMEDI